jgi:hypothetical protein
VEAAFSRHKVGEAITVLTASPGMLFRSLDRIIRYATPEELDELLTTVKVVAGKVSGRVILSVYEHLINRMKPNASRVFPNRQGKAWVAADSRNAIDVAVVTKLTELLKNELLARLPVFAKLLVDPAVRDIALPLSKKYAPEGFRIMPRGSLQPVTDGILRFFIYWKERKIRTDYDLSVQMLNADYVNAEHVSWTNLRSSDGFQVHSGDITEAPLGASEFIDIDLSRTKASYLIPQVHVYSGEDFNTAAECFFGFMSLEADQRGAPFEPQAVQVKSDLRGSGRVSLPVAFQRDDRNCWTAKWLHLGLKGWPNYNRVEANRVSTALLTRALMEREYLTLDFLVALLRQRAEYFDWYGPQSMQGLTGPVVYIGLDAPDGLPVGSVTYTLSNLHELISLTR